jgi:hypothetical protein
MKIGIFLFEQFHARKDIGSSRIRGHWLIKHWPGAEAFKLGQQYDVLIFQKVYFIELAEKFQGIKILDICDADWLHWGYRIKQMIGLCDAVTCSTQAIADYISKLTDKPVVYIPDRLDFDSFGDLKKEHHGQAKTVVWYGYQDNFPMLQSAIGSLIKNKIEELVVIANKPFQMPVQAAGKLRLSNLPWTIETVNQDLLKADIILNPQSSKGRWVYKSNNKTINAWALGIPVAHSNLELKTFLNENARQAEGDRRYQEVREKYDVRKSVEQYQELINDICAKKKPV